MGGNILSKYQFSYFSRFEQKSHTQDSLIQKVSLLYIQQNSLQSRKSWEAEKGKHQKYLWWHVNKNSQEVAPSIFSNFHHPMNIKTENTWKGGQCVISKEKNKRWRLSLFLPTGEGNQLKKDWTLEDGEGLQNGNELGNENNWNKSDRCKVGSK